MNAQTSKDIEDFNVFLNKDGKELSQVIENHFHHVKEEYARENDLVSEMKREVQNYQQEMKDGSVKRSGRTPRKLRELPALSLRTTDAHPTIKKKAKNSEALKGISYDVIHQELPKYQLEEEALMALASELDDQKTLPRMSSFQNSPKQGQTKVILK
jgi:hypothetical protein